MEVVHSKSSGKFLVRKDTRNSYMVSITRTSEQQTIYTQLPHPIIDISKDLNPSRAAMSIGVKIEIVTGTYPFQGSRAKYSNISPICELCGENDETLEHFLLECKLLYAPLRTSFHNQ